MSARKAPASRFLDTQIAYAANLRGDGVAYVALAGEERPLRVPFQCERRPALLDREVAYAALIAAAGALAAQRVRSVRLAIADERVVTDLAQRRPLPTALALLYVQLKCRLNTFARAEVTLGSPPEDLAIRARAEVELAAAA